MASGSLLAIAMRLMVARCVSSSVSHSCGYGPQSVAPANGNPLACLRLANFSGGTAQHFNGIDHFHACGRGSQLALADAAEQPHLGDDRPIGCLKLQPVLAHCPFDAGRQIERLPCLESFDVLQHVP